MKCPECNQFVADTDKVCPECGKNLDIMKDLLNQRYPDHQSPKEQADEMPMKWFKYLIYFQLFVSAAANFFEGVELLMGFSRQQYYEINSTIRGIDIAWAVLCFIIAAGDLSVRRYLANRHVKGPTFFLLWYMITAVLMLIYNTTVDLLTGQSGFYIGVGIILIIGINAVILALQYIYFKKREHLFTKTHLN